MRNHVTRTIAHEVVTAMIVNLGTKAVESRMIPLPTEYKSDKQRDKAVAELLPSNEKCVAITEINKVEQLYAMPVELFMELASVVVPEAGEETESEA